MLQEENKQLILQMAEARTQIYSIISPLADQAEAGYTDPEQKIEDARHFRHRKAVTKWSV